MIRLLPDGTHEPKFRLDGRRFIGFTDDADSDGIHDLAASNDGKVGDAS